MSDFLLNLGRNKLARKVVKTLGLPVPMPQAVRRSEVSYGGRELDGRLVAIGSINEAPFTNILKASIEDAGGRVMVEASADKRSFDGLIFDAAAMANLQDLEAVYQFFHDHLRDLKPCGRVVLLSRPWQQSTSAEVGALRRALIGFVKSLAKEVGKRAITAQVIYVADGAEALLKAPLVFFLSDRSSFISGQVIHLSAPPANIEVPSIRSLPLAGKRALVTGALRGIGNAIASQLSREGAEVFCLDLAKDLRELTAFSQSISARPVAVNLSEPAAGQEILKAIAPGLDIIVHNAGITRDKTLQNMSADAWNSTLNVNLGAIISVTESLVKANAIGKGGRVICLSSIGGIAGVFGQTNYGASKAGVIGYVELLSQKLFDSGITVNAIAPGFIETRMTRAMPVMVREVGRRFNALSQGGQPQDIAELATFLALPQSLGINGQTIRVCGLNLLGA